MDAKLVGYGIVSFFTGVFFMMIGYPLFTNLASALNTGTYAIGNTIEGIIWVGVILIWTLTTIVLPAYFINEGLKAPKDIPAVAKIIIGTLIFFFSIMITYQAWFMIEGISDSMDSTTQIGFFWVGLIINWLMITIIMPAILIIKGYEEATK